MSTRNIQLYSICINVFRHPLSPYLFIICIEFLSHEIDNNAHIKGQMIAEQEIKRTKFADDATFITDG